MKRITFAVLFFVLAGAAVAAEEVTEVPPPGPDNILAHLVQMIQEGNYAEAVEKGNVYLARAEEKYGPESPEVAAILNLVVDAMWRGGRTDEEVFALARRSLAIGEKALGPDDPEVGDSLNTLGNLSWMISDFAAAAKYYGRSLAIKEAGLGPDHPDVATMLNNLALTHYMLGEFVAARENFERALAIREKEFGPEHPVLACTLMNLGVLVRDQGLLEEGRVY
ncbi:MAG: tetratricopeptide repeat protein, partial [Acidobacteriota bacterium]|nr:tetratricopeptide repeat protein [Acidobacteriota bacterium]